MSRSPYAVTSPFGEACPACGAAANRQCVSLSKDPRKRGQLRMKAHPARRRLADEQRTREVNSKLLPPLEHDYIPIREPLPQRIPDLCPDDSRDEVKP